MKSVYSAVRTGYLNKAVCVLLLKVNSNFLPAVFAGGTADGSTGSTVTQLTKYLYIILEDFINF
jgi:hypothetical protein